MNLAQLLEYFREAFQERITSWRVIPSNKGEYMEFPQWINMKLCTALQHKGIERLYSHQYEACKEIMRKNNVVVVTPTASGKSLCYNLPVLDAILSNEEIRALYVFPTKALAQDQVSELQEYITLLGADIKTFTYDGDTPVSARKAIRQAGHIVVTNPDMLHSGILPHHTKWVKLFENLRYVVIDEIHTYRGVFGSHVANVIRRLKRICEFYGSKPQFIMSSATIANPTELCEKIIGNNVSAVTKNGAPSAEKHVVLYDPPVVNAELGIRRSVILEGARVAELFLQQDIKSIIFARSRMTLEVVLTYLKERLTHKRVKGPCEVTGYRGGYLPTERRRIEKGLRDGNIRGVVSTNALELGVDIGSLDACVMIGYPGTISSFRQQAGRVGRRGKSAAIVMIGSSLPLDQFLVHNPEYLFEASAEHSHLNPNNLHILVSHVKCAAFELPFQEGELYGDEDISGILEYLAEENVLRFVGGKWHWMTDSFPADSVSLRSATAENVIILDVTRDAKVIGEIDRVSALTTVHDEAIYLHAGKQYHVEKYDFKELKAYVKEVDVDYYTDANLAVELKVLEEFDTKDRKQHKTTYGEVLIRALPTIYKKIKFGTHENIGWGKIHLPEEQMHTTACWIALHPSNNLCKDEIQSGMVALGNLLVNVAPIFLMCDPNDIRVVTQIKGPHTDCPTVFLYDSSPGGIGLARKLYEIEKIVIEAALDLLSNCKCGAGCPSCVGPRSQVGKSGKQLAQQFIDQLLSVEEDFVHDTNDGI